MTITRMRAIGTAVLLIGTCAVVACSARVAGTATLPRVPAASAPVPSGDHAAGNPEAAAFATRMRRAVEGITTLRGSIHLSAGSAEETETFAEALTRGMVAAADMRMTVRAMGRKRSMRLLVVGTRCYLGPERTLRAIGVETGGKRWMRLTDTASNATVRQLALQLGKSASQLGPHRYVRLAAASSGPIAIGRETVAGAAATHYRLAVRLDALAATGVISGAQAAQVATSGLAQIPLDIRLDMQDRPAQVRSEFAVQDEHVELVVKLGRFDEPLTIVAPDPASVAPG